MTDTRNISGSYNPRGWRGPKDVQVQVRDGKVTQVVSSLSAASLRSLTVVHARPRSFYGVGLETKVSRPILDAFEASYAALSAGLEELPRGEHGFGRAGVRDNSFLFNIARPNRKAEQSDEYRGDPDPTSIRAWGNFDGDSGVKEAFGRALMALGQEVWKKGVHR